MTEKRETIQLSLGARSYDIFAGSGLLPDAGRLIAPVLRGPQPIIVTDRNVARLHLETLQTGLKKEGIDAPAIILEPGETTKEFAGFEKLCNTILDHRPERGTALIAFGGGVIGDIAGFAASCVLRGIDFIQIPTSLLAQVDSSVGGKTGINTSHGKNLIGSFYQPVMVLADTDVLDTLPSRELLAGYAEVVKYGLLGDADFFSWLEGHGADVIEGIGTARQTAIATSCRAKAAIVAADEKETGDRALLNFGHTFGHALEAETGFSDTLLHGESVAIGMILAFDLSVQLGLCPAEDAARVRRHFAAIGLPGGLEDVPGQVWSAESLLDHMAHDKKVRDGKITFILTRGIGDAFIADSVSPDDVLTLLRQAIAA